MAAEPYHLRVSFLSGSQGLLFALRALPRDDRQNTGVLIIPPFAEEMNRSRRMLSLQARTLAEAGFPTILIDLFGTGDSAGEFADADVETWLGDLSTGLAALRDEGCSRVVLVAVRFGALLAGRLACTAKQLISGFVFWQPVQTGSAFMTQFLRLRLAADLAGGGPSLTMKALQDELAGGGSVDVGGYILSPRLYSDVLAMNLLEDMSDPHLPRIVFMEVGARGGEELNPVMMALRDSWADKGVRAIAHKIQGVPFWQTPEITLAPELFNPTVEAVKAVDGNA